MKRFRFGIAVILAIITVAFTVVAQAGAFKVKRVNDCYKASDFSANAGTCTTQTTLPSLPNGTLPPFNPNTCTYSIKFPQGGPDALSEACNGSPILVALRLKDLHLVDLQ